MSYKMINISEELFKYNPWWEGEYSLSLIPREKYIRYLESNLKNRDIILITGLRRVGKTSIMKLMISRLLKDVKPEHILYVSLDSIPLEPFSTMEILREYRKIFKIPLEQKVYVFFDEAGCRTNIHQELKNLYDSENVKIFASSSSATILNDTRAMLTGRARLIEIMPLDFREYLQFKSITIKRSQTYLLESYFEEYMKNGGIPEYVLTGDVTYLDSLIESVIYKDIVSAFGVRDVGMVKDFYRLVMERAGKLVSINKIARILDISPDTARRYLEYFRRTYLIHLVERKGKLNERIKAPRKIYSADVGIRNLFTGFRDKGAIFENLVYLSIKEKQPLYIYQNGVEIDFYWDDTILEVKYGRNIEDKQKDFFENYPAKRKLLISTISDYLDMIGFVVR